VAFLNFRGASVPEELSLAETVDLVARELDGVPPATRILS
jgi:hypothetical protein